MTTTLCEFYPFIDVVLYFVSGRWENHISWLQTTSCYNYMFTNKRTSRAMPCGEQTSCGEWLAITQLWASWKCIRCTKLQHVTCQWQSSEKNNKSINKTTYNRITCCVHITPERITSAFSSRAKYYAKNTNFVWTLCCILKAHNFKERKWILNQRNQLIDSFAIANNNSSERNGKFS